MGWTVLYIAFGIVALWLLGEVLLQYKARLRWRLLAFTGFLCVVAGALIPSVIVIGVGIAAFATGQTFVTLSYRRGFVAGWALSGIPGASRRREEEAEDEAEFEGPPMPGERDAPEPAPALAGRNGFGSDTFEIGAPGANGYGSNRYEGNGFESNGYESNGYEANGFETRSFAGAEAFSTGAYNNYDSAQAYDSFGYGQTGYEQNGYEADPYQTSTNGSGIQQPVQQQPIPVYQPGPMPDETGEFALSGYDSFGYPSAGQRGMYPEPAEQQQQYAAYSDPYHGYDGNSGYAGASFDGYGTDGYGTDGYGTDGYGSGYGGIGEVPGYSPQQQSPYGNGAPDGYGNDAYGTDGYGTNGYGMNGYGTDGYSTDGYGTSYDMGGGTYGGEQAYFPQAPTGGGGVWVPQQRDPNEQVQPEQQPYPYQDDPNGYGSQNNGYYY